jgi:hypothetical protein
MEFLPGILHIPDKNFGENPTIVYEISLPYFLQAKRQDITPDQSVSKSFYIISNLFSAIILTFATMQPELVDMREQEMKHIRFSGLHFTAIFRLLIFLLY